MLCSELILENYIKDGKLYCCPISDQTNIKSDIKNIKENKKILIQNMLKNGIESIDECSICLKLEQNSIESRRLRRYNDNVIKSYIDRPDRQNDNVNQYVYNIEVQKNNLNDISKYCIGFDKIKKILLDYQYNDEDKFNQVVNDFYRIQNGRILLYIVENIDSFLKYSDLTIHFINKIEKIDIDVVIDSHSLTDFNNLEQKIIEYKNLTKRFKKSKKISIALYTKYHNQKSLNRIIQMLNKYSIEYRVKTDKGIKV